jgi:predicted GH43/DUF377 family glycosyl hydrolase
MIPTPLRLEKSLVRIYFSGRNDKNQSHIGWALVDLDGLRVVDCSADPVLAPGPLGCFDDNGVTPSCVLSNGGETLLYYIGWNPGSTVRMHLFGGLAISRDGGQTFERWSNAPILERVRVNPYLNTAPFVLKEGSRWRMYYVGGTGWSHRDLPRYNIQIAESVDGRHWQREGKVAIPFNNDEENALARPFVLNEDGIYKMWFAHKGAAYRMGYAESADGLHWERNDSFGGLDVTAGEFDSEMIEYFAVVPYEGRKIMFYNGNDYGRNGFGVAIED